MLRDVTIGVCPSAAGGNTGISLSNLQVGTVDRDVRLEGNVGFTDSEATTWANAITVGRFRIVSANAASGSPGC